MRAFKELLQQSSVQKDDEGPPDFDQQDDISTREEFIKELTKVGGRSLWSLLVIILMCMPGFCYILLHTNFTKVTTSNFDTRCLIPELENANWTYDDIRTISTPANANCSYYLYNYVILRGMGFKKALKRTRTLRPPSVARCETFVHRSHNQYSLYQEFSLVCKQAIHEEFLNISPVYGKIFASLFLVPLADLIGRKQLINWGVRIFLAGGLVVALAPSFEALVFGRVLIGMAYTTMIHSIEAVVVEISSIDVRPLRFIAMNTGIALGYCIVPLIATKVWHWRTLQWAVCSSLLILPLTAWLVPESPRWFFSKGRKAKAWATLHTLRDPVAQSELLTAYRNDRKNYISEVHEHVNELRHFLTSKLWFLTALFAFVGAVYFKNFVGRFPMKFIVTRKIYLILSGGVEMISYMVCLALLLLPSRRTTMGISFFTCAILYIIASQLKIGSIEGLVCILLTEIASGSIHTSARLYIAENVPTSHRCTIAGFAEGMGAGISTIIMFNLYANFIQDKVLFLLLGCICLLGTIMSYFAYEVKGKDIFDTIREMKRFRG
ncbi:hypothetical protein ILUMI_08745 [Ignelater luminosus]|uniref:Major facilitator superfamily (MFS) profile domain-containing protein n=1 Tax=Ignelater luminosus TaxID=2038154 RepID=A0A8K0GF53_IGNLU|nr:hypothetical protein ILUMI_08745 [Ignelater luminosus]